MASMILGSVGSSMLGPLGGLIGSALGGAIDKALFGGTEQGPRIDDLTTIRADPGVPIPLVYGADRIPGIVIATSELIETKHKERVGSFLGIGGQKVVTYTYHVDIDWLLSEGPILGVGRIWADGNIIRTTRYEMDLDTEAQPEHIGAMTYPSYYLQHYYEPTEVSLPWSIDQRLEANWDGNYYLTPDRETFIEITEAEALAIVEGTEDKRVVYWYDTGREKYIPIIQSHEYENKTLKSTSSLDILELGGTLPAAYHTGNTLIETSILYKVPGDPLPGDMVAVTTQNYALVTGTAGLTNDDARLLNSFAFYEAGSTAAFEGQFVLGGLIDFWPKTAEDGDGTSGTFIIPEGTEYIVWTSNYSITFPVFSDMEVFQGEWYATYSEAAEEDLVRDWPDYYNLYDAINDWSAIAVLSFEGPDDVTVYRGTFDQATDPTMAATLGLDVPAYVGRAHIVFDRFELEDYGNRIPSLTFEVVQFDNVRVGDVITDMMNRADISSDYYILEGLPTQGVSSHVLGYTVASRSDLRSAMETMLEAFRIDVAEVGDCLLFRIIDRASEYEIPIEHLGGREPTDEVPDLISYEIRDEVEMPRKLTIRYKDVERDYQVNTAMYFRKQGSGIQDSLAEIAAVLPPSVAKQYVADRLRDAWFDRVTVSFKLPPMYVYLAPTDIVTIKGASLGKSDFTIKIKQVNRGANGLLEVEGSIRETAFYVPAEGEERDFSTDNLLTGTSTVTNIIPTPLVAFHDLPPVRETHEDFGWYVTIYSQGQQTLDAAELYRSSTEAGSYDYLFRSVDIANYGTMTFIEGNVDSSGNTIPANTSTLDTEVTFVVQLADLSDTLQSITADQLLEGGNLCVIGSEILQFQTAELVIAGQPGVYRLSGLLRGRRATNDAARCDNHESLADEPFFMLGDGVIDYRASLNRLNQTNYYKAVFPSGLPSEYDAVSFASNGERITPSAPTMITGTRDGSNNLTITWARTDRTYQGVYEGTDIPNSEGFVEFDVDIMDGPTVVRTETVTDATTLEYSAANQTSDGLTPGDPVTVRVYQKSATIGRGHVGEAIV